MESAETLATLNEFVAETMTLEQQFKIAELTKQIMGRSVNEIAASVRYLIIYSHYQAKYGNEIH